MGKRLAPVLAFLAMWVPVAGYALGLGNITMNSALNEPLNAEIELLSVQSGDLDNLVVKMASSEDFARVGAERNIFLTRIAFSVEKKADGKPYVKMSSTQTVTEPFLDFVVEARWPRGRILREFTVLVDPPVLSEETPAPVQQAVVTAQPVLEQQISTTTRNEDFFRRAPEPQRDAMQPVERQQGELVYGPVKYKDTLWGIANDMKPGGTTVNQMMAAIVRNNPQAFYNNNVNQLKAGYVLRVKDVAEVTALTVAEADTEIERQRVEWLARKSGKLVQQAKAPAGGQVDRAAGTATATQAMTAGSESEARLKLVAPGSAGAGSGAGTESTAQLQQDLLLAAEALEANRQETEELKSRLQEMEEQLTAMQRLIALKDDEMALLQNQLSGDQAATDSGSTMVDATAPAEVMSDSPMPEAEQPADAAMMQEPQESMAPEPVVEAPAPKPQVMPAPVETGFMDEVMSIVDDPMSLLAKPMFVYGGIGILVLIILGIIVARRRRMQDGFEESILNVGAATADAGESVMSGMSGMGESSAMVSDFAMSEMSGLSGIQADASDVDPVSEADVYLAYGRHQQAEDILKEAIKTTPDRHELKLKMLEVYFAAKNREAFEQQAQELHDALGNESDPIWAKAVTMGAQLCPGSDLFGGASAESLQKELVGGENDEDLLDFDFDFDTTDLDSGKAGEVGASSSETDEMFAAIDSISDESESDIGDLDFDLDTGDTAVAEISEDNQKTAVAEAGSDLDFDVSSLDFNLDDENPKAAAAKDNSLDFDLDATSGEDAEAELDEVESPDLDATALGAPEVADSGVGESALDMDLDLGELSFDEDEQDLAGKTQMIETDLDFTPSSEKLEEPSNDSSLELDVAMGMDDLSLQGSDDALSLDIEDEGLDLELPGEADDDMAFDSDELSLSNADETDLGDLEDFGDDVFGEVDEVGTKLDLARAYVDMGDSDGARGILNEVIEEGDDSQKSQAKELLEQIG